MLKELYLKNPQSIKVLLKKSYIYIISILIFPTLLSTFISFFYTNKYNTLISNIADANIVTDIAKEDLSTELWDIVSGKKTFTSGTQYVLLHSIDLKIKEMLKRTKNEEDIKTLEIASRTTKTLYRNVNSLGSQIYSSSTVSENLLLLDEIRSISSLFSEVMQDYITSEIKLAERTNILIQRFAIGVLAIEIFLTCMAILGSIFAIKKLSNSINNTISEMEQFTTKVSKGNLTVRLNEPSLSEVYQLAMNLNSMAERIDILIKENIEEQKNLQRMEMKALQAQITPHFLYNTFDTIIWLAEEERTEEVIKITSAFCQFLRTSLSRGHEFITVEQELDHVRNYLTIQKVRYADILNYTIETDDDLNSYSMLKLTLQPLIENAIYHGIKNKRGRGNLKLTAKFTNEEKNTMTFCIEDDGAGFTEKRLQEVLDELKSKKQEQLNSVYGLYNVNKKLVLYYNESTDGIHIESTPGQGSKIFFTVPCIKKEDVKNV